MSQLDAQIAQLKAHRDQAREDYMNALTELRKVTKAAETARHNYEMEIEKFTLFLQLTLERIQEGSR